MIKYYEDPINLKRIEEIVRVLNFDHINMERISVVKSHGTSSRNIIARCHALPKIMQQGLKTDAFYIIEVIFEKFDKLSEEDQIKTLIHELMHIPKSFGGGFRFHDFVSRKNVDKFYEIYMAARKENPERINEIINKPINEK